jgi:hypothetical protein
MIYVLILGVIAVWAIIIMKVVNAGKDDNESKLAVGNEMGDKTEKKWYMVDYPIDSIDLTGVKDPFKNHEEEPKLIAINNNETKIIAPPIFKPQVIWPKIQFQGFASKRNQKTGRYAIININNQPLMLAEGEIALGVKLKKNWGDSLALSFQKESKKFYLQTQ